MAQTLERGELELVPSLEASVIDAAQSELPQEISNLFDSVKGSDEAGTKGALDAISLTVQKLVDKSTAAVNAETNPKAKRGIQVAVSDFEKFLSEIKNYSLKNSKDRSEPQVQARVERASQELLNTINNLKKTLKADAIAGVQEQEITLEHLSSAMKRKDARRLASSTKAFATNHKNLATAVRQVESNDPVRKEQTAASVAELDALLPRQINAVKDALQDPSNAESQAALERAVNGSRVALATLRDSLHPTTASSAEKLAALDAAQMELLRAFSRRGDRERLETALERTKQTQESLKKLADEELSKPYFPEREKLGGSVRDMVRLFDKVAQDARNAAQNPNDKQKQLLLEDSINQRRKPVESIVLVTKDTEEAKPSHLAIANSIVARMQPRKMTARQMLDASEALAAHLNTLAHGISIQAHKGRETATGRAAAALDLDSLLSKLDRLADDGAQSRGSKLIAPALNTLISDLETLSQATSSPQTSLEHSISQVAESLKKRSKGADGEQLAGKHTSNIGAELVKLAEACKEGQRQQFLISARAISGYVRALSLDVKMMSNNCPDPELKERLLKSTQALQNFSVQLKILASVKAASTTPDPDAEHQLAILTQNLGRMLNMTISAVNVVHLKYHIGIV